MVYIVNDGGQVVSSRSGDNNLLSACIDVSLSLSLGGVESSTLQNYVNADLSPGKLCSVSLSVNLNLFSIYSDRILTSLNLVSQCVSSLSRIVLQ